VLSESAATLVLDHKARVVYATDKLATMLGYPVASLLKMELGALLPQPYCQMHGAWFKVSCLSILHGRILLRSMYQVLRSHPVQPINCLTICVHPCSYLACRIFHASLALTAAAQVQWCTCWQRTGPNCQSS
jgi:hypothetical protein